LESSRNPRGDDHLSLANLWARAYAADVHIHLHIMYTHTYNGFINDKGKMKAGYNLL